MAKDTIGFIGLGKLGCPLAVSIASRGFKILGYDINPNLMRKQVWPHMEAGPDGRLLNFQEYLDSADITYLPLKDIVQGSDILFICVQTPHGPQYEGTTRLPFTRADFNYQYLREAAQQIAKYTDATKTTTVISTVLPGTMKREVLPYLPSCCYSPAFPAMGTVMRDFLQPEFVLLGGNDAFHRNLLWDFYLELLDENKSIVTSIESAELAKCAYNTMVTMKVTVANTMMEICHKIPGCDIDEVSEVLEKATRRVSSPAYLRGGMGDSGPCHPRDNIAMSWLAEKLKLSSNLFDKVMEAREWQTEWLAHLFCNCSNGMKKIILGKGYKAETAITTGSSAILLANILNELHVDFLHWDPYVDNEELDLNRPAAFFIATKHEYFAELEYPPGSVVVDPFRYIPAQDSVRIVPIGVGK